MTTTQQIETLTESTPRRVPAHTPGPSATFDGLANCDARAAAPDLLAALERLMRAAGVTLHAQIGATTLPFWAAELRAASKVACAALNNYDKGASK